VAYQTAVTAVTLNDLEGHSLVAGLSNAICRTPVQHFCTISTDSLLAQFLCISCCLWHVKSAFNVIIFIVIMLSFFVPGHSGGCLTLSPPIPLRLYILPYWSNPPFLMFDIRALWHSGLSARAPECQKLKMMGYTCMVLDPLNGSNLEQLALKGLSFCAGLG